MITHALLALAVAAAERTVVLDNATVTVTRVLVPPGTTSPPKTDRPTVVVNIASGHVTFVPAGLPRSTTNDGGPFEQLEIALKRSRPAAPAAPPTEAPPGITRTTLIDNADVRVVRVRFAPGSREPVHTHPNDLLTVQLTPGRFDVRSGTNQTGGREEAGSVRFLPRDVPHAYISTDAEAFELLSISVK